MATISPRVGFTLAGDGGAGEGGDDLVDVTAHISNNYSLIDKLLGVVRFTTAAGKPTTNNYEGKIAQEIDNGNLFIYDGAQWQILPGSTFTCTSGTRPTAPYTVYQGLRIWETDTKAWGVYDGANWVMWDTQWQTYTPVWSASGTQPVLNNGTIAGKYFRKGREVSIQINLLVGSTTAVGTGQYYFNTPPGLNIQSVVGGLVPIGVAIVVNSGNYYASGPLNLQSATTFSIFIPTSAVNTTQTQWTHNSPWVVKSGDSVNINASYPLA